MGNPSLTTKPPIQTTNYRETESLLPGYLLEVEAKGYLEDGSPTCQCEFESVHNIMVNHFG